MDPAPTVTDDRPEPYVRLAILASSSSGNCAVLQWSLRTGSSCCLIDLGLSPKRTRAGLRHLGLEIDCVDHVLLTHLDADHWHDGWSTGLPARTTLRMHRRHHDHARRHSALPVRVEQFTECFDLSPSVRVTPVVMSHDELGVSSFRIEFDLSEDGAAWPPARRDLPGKPLGSIAPPPRLTAAAIPPAAEPPSLFPAPVVRPLNVSDHRASPAAPRTGPVASLGYATDLGHVPARLTTLMAEVDVLAIESNYCPRMQAASSRPEFLKRRIMGGSGHLSNQQCAAAVEAIRPREHVVLLHLSRECNQPSLAAEHHAGADYAITIASPDTPTRWVRVGAHYASSAAHGLAHPRGAVPVGETAHV